MCAHQATLDYVNQLLEVCSAEDGDRWRYEHNRYAEEHGRLNHRWLSLQQTLNSQVRNRTVPHQVLDLRSTLTCCCCLTPQVQEAEQELRSRVEQEARLQQISRWISDQSRWIDSAQTPSSRAELQQSLAVCQVRGHICVTCIVTWPRRSMMMS